MPHFNFLEGELHVCHGLEAGWCILYLFEVLFWTQRNVSKRDFTKTDCKYGTKNRFRPSKFLCQGQPVFCAMNLKLSEFTK